MSNAEGGFYRYIAVCWDPIEEKEEEVAGLIYGTSWSNVGQSIENWYGDELISINIYPLELGNVYEFQAQNSDSNLFTIKVNKTGVEEWQKTEK